MTSSDLSTRLICYLVEPAVRSMALAALAGAALAIARAKDATMRLAVWAAVLYASLAMPFLARLAPTVGMPVPAFVAARFTSASAQGVTGGAVIGSQPRDTGAARPLTPSPVRPVIGQPLGLPLRPATRNVSWQFAIVVLYLLIAAVLLGRLAMGFYFSRRLRLLSRPISDGPSFQFVLGQSRRWALRAAPGLAESPAVAVPVTLGWRRPVILLPLAWRGWRDKKTHAVLAHELSHVARKDTWTLSLAAIHRSIFWFNPLAWWLERHLAALAEQASDDAALRAGTDRVFYAEVLLDFLQDLRSAVGRVRWEGVGMTHGKRAQARVDRILDSSLRLSASLRKPVWALIALLAAPGIYVLAGARPVVAQKYRKADSHLAAAMTNAVPPADWQAPAAEPQPAPAPVAPASPKPAPVAAPAPKPHSPPAPAAGEWRYKDAGEDWVFTLGDSLSMSGSMDGSEVERLRTLRLKSTADFVWFRRNGKSYVIRDAETVQRAQELYSPERLLERTQEVLDAKQEAFISQQEELHKRLDQVRVYVPDLTAQLATLQTELDLLHKHEATLDELNELQSNLKGLQGTLSELQGEAGGEMGAIGGVLDAMGGRMADVGDQLREMNEKLTSLEKNNAPKMKELLDDALAKGLALPE